MNPTKKSLLTYLFAPLLVLGLGVSQSVEAHKGHAGPMVSFMKTKAALKQMLPADARITKRKQPLDDEAVEWAEEQFDADLDSKIYSYYLATDRGDKSFRGAAYVSQMHYRHGDLKFAVGIDADKRVTQVAILGVNEKYVVDFEGSVGTAIIADYAGLSLAELVSKAQKLASADKASREFAAAVRDAAVLLAAFSRY